MLRICVIAIIAVLIAIIPGLLNWNGFYRTGYFGFWYPVIWLIILLLCLVFERIRYKKELTAPPGPDWLATEECSVDECGLVRVWYHPRSGERAYVREQSGRLS